MRKPWVAGEPETHTMGKTCRRWRVKQVRRWAQVTTCRLERRAVQQKGSKLVSRYSLLIKRCVWRGGGKVRKEGVGFKPGEVEKRSLCGVQVGGVDNLRRGRRRVRQSRAGRKKRRRKEDEKGMDPSLPGGGAAGVGCTERGDREEEERQRRYSVPG